MSGADDWPVVRFAPLFIQRSTEVAPLARRYTSTRVQQFTESLIRDMTRVNNRFGAINLAQGFPEFNPPDELIEAAHSAMDGDFHQYAITWGTDSIRQAIADKFASFNGVEVDPTRHVTVCCGATESMMAAMMAVINPGEEVIIFEPFYENYGPDALLSGGKPVYVQLYVDGDQVWFEEDELRAAFTPNTKAIVINTPQNPIGKVYSLEELQLIADLCQEYDVIALTDEPYEHIIYDGAAHHSIASLPGMVKRTVTVNSLSKTYSATGWRIGWAIAADDDIATGIRRVHDFMSIGAAHPLQEAAATAMTYEPAYYQELTDGYQRRRDMIVPMLRDAGFDFPTPMGAYYVMSKYPDCGYDDDLEFSCFLCEEIGVTPVPGRAFYHSEEAARPYVRFAFAKNESTLEQVGERLSRLDEFRR